MPFVIVQGVPVDTPRDVYKQIVEGVKDQVAQVMGSKPSWFEVDIVDISAIDKNIWLPRLQEAEVLFFGGGNTFHLMHWVKQSGLIHELPQLLKTRIYAGISAGSCIAGPTIFNSVQNLFGETYPIEVKEGLGLVNFQFIPHLNSPYFEKIKVEYIEKAAKELTEPVYALDYTSALKVVDNNVEVVSEGVWKKFN